MLKAFIVISPPGVRKKSVLNRVCKEERLWMLDYHRFYDQAKSKQPQAVDSALKHLADQKMSQAIAEALGAGLNILVNTPHVVQSSRRILTERCRRHGAQTVVCTWIMAPKEETLAAADDAVKARAIWEKLEADPPSIEDGFDEVRKYEVPAAPHSRKGDG